MSKNIIIRIGQIIHVIDDNRQCYAAIVIEVGSKNVACVFTHSGYPNVKSFNYNVFLDDNNWHRIQECQKEMYY